MKITLWLSVLTLGLALVAAPAFAEEPNGSEELDSSASTTTNDATSSAEGVQTGNQAKGGQAKGGQAKSEQGKQTTKSGQEKNTVPTTTPSSTSTGTGY